MGDFSKLSSARVPVNVSNQTIQLPSGFHLDSDEVIISRLGESILITPANRAADVMLEGLYGFSDDFMSEGREQGTIVKRRF